MAGGAGDSGNEGKARQFRDLVLPHLDDVYTLARYLMGSAADAEDAAQECYLRAFRHINSYRGPAIKPWLLAILRNTCRAAYAKNANVVYRDSEAENTGVAAPPIWIEAVDTPERLVLRQHDTDTMRRLIEGLPSDFRGGDRAARDQRTILPRNRHGHRCADRHGYVAAGAGPRLTARCVDYR